MDVPTENKSDDVVSHDPSSDGDSQVPPTSIAIIQKRSDPDLTKYPTQNKVQGSGSCFCPDNKMDGTLGVRVARDPESGYCYIATYHNFGDNSTNFVWQYNDDGDLESGQVGQVVAKKYQLGPTSQVQLLDCALIQLKTKTASSILPSLFQGPGQPVMKVKGTRTNPANGWPVMKYGMNTGLTYGLTLPLPTKFDPIYDEWILVVQRCDDAGQPLPGDFAGPADSGAPVFDKWGFVVGMVLLGIAGASADYPLTIVSRIDKVEAALSVKVQSG